MSSKRQRNEPQVVGFLGLGLDNTDGHKRVTQSEHFLLVGGSQETHERMQDTAMRFADGLRQRGKELRQTSLGEIVELFQQALE